MVKTLKLLARTARPRQWLKNLALFTGIIFSGQLLNPTKFSRVGLAVLLFSILTSAVYIFNDLWDIESDRKHPFKRRRPLAAGELSAPLALFVAISGFTLSLFFMAQLGFFFFLLGLIYFLMQVSYTIRLKQVPILDVLTIASGFILRVYAGAVVIDTHINVWLLLCVISFSLFLAVGKRRSELTLLSGRSIKAEGSRKVLGCYTEQLLDVYCGMFANTAWLTWTLYTFLQPPVTLERAKLVQFFSVLPRTFYSQKWLMLTIPFVIYGVMRYLQLIYEKNKGESPARILLSDKPLITAILIWVTMTVGIIYLI